MAGGRTDDDPPPSAARREAYSVNSRLIGQYVEVPLYVEHLEAWYGQKVEASPHLRGSNHHRVSCRHVIDWLVRQSGTFADHRYRGVKGDIRHSAG